MGTSHALIVANKELYSMKSEVEPWLLSIFRESDKRIFTRKHSEAIGWVHSGEDYDETAYIYSNSVKNIKQRLDVMGFSIRKIRDEYDSVVRKQINNIEGKRARRGDLPELEILKKFTFDEWLASFRFILANDVKKDCLPQNPPELVKYLFSNYSAGLEEFPHEDFLSYLRVYLEACPDENALAYLDITYLVENDYYYPEDKVCEQGLERLTLEYSPYQKIIVLTEGSTDSQILNGSLQLLFPHLYGYYSFMDFGLSNAAGSASQLVNNLKAFIGAGVSNRVIALFDNDTAAKVHTKALQTIDFPQSIKVLHYPNLEFAEHYPTVGPNGKSENNINGLACSIELYLGLDILTIDGALSPVHWKGYDDSLKQYQGEIENKKTIQKNFFAKLEQCKNDSRLIEKMDWSAMHLVFQSIFNAFS